MDQLENRLAALSDFVASPMHQLVLKLCLAAMFLGFFAFDLRQTHRKAVSAGAPISWPKVILNSTLAASRLVSWYGVMIVGVVILGVIIWSASQG